MANFLITAMGRSGTRFLQTVMDKSKVWEVKHEPGPPVILAEHELKNIQKRFNSETKKYGYYGEVNSLLRYAIGKLEVDEKGIIIRDPVEVWVSIANRRHSKTWLSALIDYEATIQEFRELRKNGRIPIIDFKKMTTDKNYLSTLLKFFEIDDVKIGNGLIKKKMNKTEKFHYSSLKDFDEHIQNRILRLRDEVMSWR